jgi:hypothetical protein
MPGHVVALDPPQLLTITWEENAKGCSEVTFELKPDGANVLLTLTHRRLPDRAELVGVSGGWHTHLDLLADLLGERAPAPFWTKFTKLEAEYEKGTPPETMGSVHPNGAS